MNAKELENYRKNDCSDCFYFHHPTREEEQYAEKSGTLFHCWKDRENIPDCLIKNKDNNCIDFKSCIILGE